MESADDQVGGLWGQEMCSKPIFVGLRNAFDDMAQTKGHPRRFHSIFEQVCGSKNRHFALEGVQKSRFSAFVVEARFWIDLGGILVPERAPQIDMIRFETHLTFELLN